MKQDPFNPLGGEQKQPELPIEPVEEVKFGAVQQQQRIYDALGRLITLISWQPSAAANVNQMNAAQYHHTGVTTTITMVHEAWGDLVITMPKPVQWRQPGDWV